MTNSFTPTTITAAELAALLERDPLTQVLDVRTAGEFEAGHIPGSFNVPLDTLREHRQQLAEVEHPVVLVCQSGARATTANQHLASAGKTNLRLLEGGMNGWQAAGQPVRKLRDRWAMDRQVRLVAGSLVAASIAASVAFPKARFLAGAVGAGLTFSAVTNTCAMANLLGKLPYNRGNACDVSSVLDDMAAATRAAA